MIHTEGDGGYEDSQVMSSEATAQAIGSSFPKGLIGLEIRISSLVFSFHGSLCFVTSWLVASSRPQSKMCHWPCSKNG